MGRWSRKRGAAGGEFAAGALGGWAPGRRRYHASIRLAPAVSDNVWLVSGDPGVKSHRHHDFDLPKTHGMQPPLIHAGRRWIFVRTYFGRQRDGSETRWLMFRDDGPVVDDLSPQRSEK
jgi:hypothetical protein